MTDQHRLPNDCTTDSGWTEIPAHRSIESKDLLAGERVIIIRHGDHGEDEYRLRLTASGKLILTR